jgi:hypothetical protein
VKKKNDDHRVVTFETVGEFIAAADTKKGQKTKVSHTGTDPDFHGTATFGEAVALATKGWPEGAERLTKLRAELESVVDKAVAAKSCRLEWDVTGDFLDVGRVLSGEPEACGSFREGQDSQPSTRVIKLVANLSALGGVKQKSIFSAGAAVFAAVDVLETLGHRVELWLGSGSHSRISGDRLTVLVKAKDASQPFEPDRIAFFLAHNASLRRLFFSVEEDLGFSPNTTGTCPLLVEEGAVATPEVNQGDTSAAARAARVLQVCESCGVSFSAEEREAIVS